jgi:hypothetical protein
VKLTAARLIDHGAARDVCETLTKRKLVPWLGGAPVCDADLGQFAEDFAFLQLARHRADYDYAYSPTKADALTAIARADRAMTCLEQARKSCPDQVEAMCVAMFAGHSLRKRLAR